MDPQDTYIMKTANYLFPALQQAWSDRQYAKMRQLVAEIDRTPICKFMPLPYVEAMIRDRRLRIGRVNSWDDPYENVLLKQIFTAVLNHQKFGVLTDQTSEEYYGQSWALAPADGQAPDSDAMWRIYAPKSHLGDCDKYAVCICTTVGKLWDAAAKAPKVQLPDGSMIKLDLPGLIWIGQVEYLSDSELLDQIPSQVETNDLHKHIAKMLMLKRSPFAHEQEVRLVAPIDSSAAKKIAEKGADPGALYYDIDPNDFLVKVFADSRCVTQECVTGPDGRYQIKEDDWVYRRVQERLIDAGLNPELIDRSHLYDYPPIREITLS